jgi:hypothetical protein
VHLHRERDERAQDIRLPSVNQNESRHDTTKPDQAADNTQMRNPLKYDTSARRKGVFER